jgi:hypothetical protein
LHPPGPLLQSNLSYHAPLRDLYEVLVLSFGQEFPEIESPDLVHQAFSVVVAGIGLASFALVLALVEQVSQWWGHALLVCQILLGQQSVLGDMCITC